MIHGLSLSAGSFARPLTALALAATMLPWALAAGVGWADDHNDNQKERKDKGEEQAGQPAAEGRPDLKIEYAGFNAPGAGQQVVTFTVSNVGTAGSSAVMALVVTLEPEATPARRELSVASLAPGASADVVYPLAAPCNGHRVLATVDDPLDARQANNRAEAEVCPSGASIADLVPRPGEAAAVPGLLESTVTCCSETEPTTPATTVHAARPGIITKLPIVAGGTAVNLEVGATGDGPADQDECDKWGQVINSGMDQLKNALGEGDDARAQQWSSYLDAREEDATNRGCFIVY